MERLSIIVPCFNEEENIENTVISLMKVLKRLIEKKIIHNSSYIGIVDDGSTDNSWELFVSLKNLYGDILQGIRLTENFGHQKALMAGMINFDFDFCITLDADLQHDPSYIPYMIKKYLNGYDVVCGVKKFDFSEGFCKKIIALLYYVFIKFLNGNIIIGHSDYRLLSKKAVNEISEKILYNKVFLRGIIPGISQKKYYFKYNVLPRKYGKPKYTFKKSYDLARDGFSYYGKNSQRYMVILLLLNILYPGRLFRNITLTIIFLHIILGFDNINENNIYFKENYYKISEMVE